MGEAAEYIESSSEVDDEQVGLGTEYVAAEREMPLLLDAIDYYNVEREREIHVNVLHTQQYHSHITDY